MPSNIKGYTRTAHFIHTPSSTYIYIYYILYKVLLPDIWFWHCYFVSYVLWRIHDGQDIELIQKKILWIRVYDVEMKFKPIKVPEGNFLPRYDKTNTLMCIY